MLEFVKKHRERITLISVGVAFFVLVGGGVYLQKRNETVKEPHQKPIPTKIEISKPGKKGSKQEAGKTPSTRAATFFLKPLPGELMEMIADLDSLDESVATKKFSGLPVMWAVFYFSVVKKKDNIVSIQLDVSEDGFGVIVMCDVDVNEYPQILKIESGRKIWVGGEILAVDPSGTGTVYLKTDYVSFTDPAELELPLTVVE